MTTSNTLNAISFASTELDIPQHQVAAVAKLFEEGNTLPFIARYRKEVHGNLDELKIQCIHDKMSYFNGLEARRETILKSIEEQGALTEELKTKLAGCLSKVALEDLYLPYKPKKRTRATIAKEKRLEPLARLIAEQTTEGTPEAEAANFISEEKGVTNADEALAGARDIVAEQIAERAEIRALIRNAYLTSGTISSEATGKGENPNKYKDYFYFSQPIESIPSHRYLAIRRGEREKVLRRKLHIEAEPQLERIREICGVKSSSPFAAELEESITDSYKRLLTKSIEVDVSVTMKQTADRAAVEVFAKNLRNLLLAAPFGGKPVIGIDPGLRSGCKCVALNATGQFMENITIYPAQGDEKKTLAEKDLAKLIEKHTPQAIAVGNGTAGRETETFVKKLLKQLGKTDIQVIPISEAGASVYSASDIAREEFPDLDLTVRGAISIGRRLQDPLAELVKIDPRSIGVGQYQHDIYPKQLKDKLEEVVISCVNHVGVELNTASAPLLARVAGIGPTLAENIIAFRNENGAFKNRQQLNEVSGLGPKAFEQAAGFLRIHGGEHPLDASAVHPERYALVEQMATDLGEPLSKLMGNLQLADRIDASNYVSDKVGELTLRDILNELKKPGRDPRDHFEAVDFNDDVQELADLKEGMKLSGIVTNVTAFGAFVDIGVHQDGLIHISQLADHFVSDPAEVIQTGDQIKVRVLEVDIDRKRISLSARKPPAAAPQKTRGPKPQGNRPPKKTNGPRRPKKQQNRRPPKRDEKPQSGFFNNPFGDL